MSSAGHGFARHGRSACRATFSAFEADLLRSLAAQIIELLRSEAAPAGDTLEGELDFSGPTDEPEDPVLARLLPTAYPEDDDAAADFRRFTEGSLRSGKVASAGTLIGSLERAGLAEPQASPDTAPQGDVEVELVADEAMSWLRSLTDIRLALATRLEVREGDEGYWESLPEDDPRKQVHAIYEWVGFLQETLVDAVS